MPSLIMNFLQGLEHYGEGMVQGVVNPVAKFGNEVGALGEAVTGNVQGAQNILNPGGGLLHQGGVLQGKEVTNKPIFGDVGNITKTIGTGLEIGSNLVAPEAASGERNLAMGFLRGAAKAAPMGAIGTAGGELASGESLDPTKISEGAAMTGVIGGVVGGVKSGINNIKSVYAATPSRSLFTPEDLDSLAKAEDQKAITKQVQDQLGQVVADKVAPAIAKTNDSNVVANIIDNALAQHTDEPISRPAPEPTQPQPTEPTAPEPTQPQSSTPFMNTPGEQPKPTTLMDATGSGVERGFTTSVKKSEVVSPEVKALVDQKYNPQSNQVLTQKTGTLLDQGLDKASRQVDTALSKPTGTIGSQDVSDAMTVARAHDVRGDYDKAQAIYDRLAQHGTAAGQTIQAFSMLNNRTPEGLRVWVSKTLDKAKIPLEGDLKDQLNAAFGALRESPEDTPGHGLAVGKIQQLVEQNLPSSATDKAFAVWRAGLLTGPQTVAKIVTSHAVNSALENAKDIPGAAIDKFLSLFTGQRSLVASGKGYLEGAQQGTQAGKELLKTGVDVNPGTSIAEMRNSVNLGNSVPGKFLQAYVNGVGRIHGSLYKPFFGAAHLQSLYNQGLAAAKTQGLKGAESDNFVTNFVHSPTPDALKVAQHDAEMATFQQTTKLGQVASAIQQKGGIIGKVIAPFTKIPSAIATDLFNYSPVGAMKSIMDGIKAARSEEGLSVEAQRQLSQGLGRSIVGTAAIVPGIMLYNKGMLTLGYPTDPKEQALWKDEGKQPDSVLVGGQWRGLGAIGPLGSVLAIGGHMADSLVQGKDMGSAALAGLAGGAQSIESQSYLQGVNNAIQAVNSPDSKMNSFAKSTAGSIVPTALNTVANATDSYRRDTTGNNALESSLAAIKSRIPGLRESLPKQIDAFGNPLKSGETGIERIIDPFQSSTAATPSPLLSELRRLQNAGYGEMPTAVTKKENFGTTKQPENAVLTRDQMKELTTDIGQSTEAYWQQATEDPSYGQLTDDQKQTLLKSLYSSAAAQGKSEFAQKYQLGPYSPNVLQTIQQSKQKRLQVV